MRQNKNTIIYMLQLRMHDDTAMTVVMVPKS
jgi:hypothetical protein